MRCLAFPHGVHDELARPLAKNLRRILASAKFPVLQTANSLFLAEEFAVLKTREFYCERLNWR